jgi:hypothetical protein
LQPGLFYLNAYFLPFGFALDALAAAFFAGTAFFADAFVAMLVAFFSSSHWSGTLSVIVYHVRDDETNLYLFRLIPNR